MNDDRVLAVLTPPQLEQFRTVCDVQGELAAVFSGWYKHVLLSDDRAFLFPRASKHVGALEREAEVLQALEPFGFDFVPRLLGRWQDDRISPYPFIATNRLPGRPYESVRPTLALDQVASFMAEVGRVVAAWHSLDAVSLPPLLQQDNDPLFGLLGRLTTEQTVADGLREAESILANHLQDRSLEQWLPAFRELAHLAPVLLHGDVCGNQFLVDQTLYITGVVDWGRAHVGHPLRDFLFGEWSLALYDWEASFALLREHMWESYRRQRSLPLPSPESVHALFTIADAVEAVERLASEAAPTDWLLEHHERCLENLKALR